MQAHTQTNNTSGKHKLQMVLNKVEKGSCYLLMLIWLNDMIIFRTNYFIRFFFSWNSWQITI